MEAHKSGAKCFLSYDGIYVINILATDQVSSLRKCTVQVLRYRVPSLLNVTKQLAEEDASKVNDY
jgi:hypothetical protein